MPHVPDTVPGKRVHGAEARTEGRGQPSNIRGGTRIQESCTYGSVRGAPSNGRPYRNHETGSGFGASSEFRADRLSARRYPSGQSSASANPIERFRRIEEPTRRRMKTPTLSAGHRGTESSNPFPSSTQSVSFRISPWFLEKAKFSASVGRMPDGAVGRDAQVQQHRAEEPVVSLSGDISVPQCRRCGSRR